MAFADREIVQGDTEAESTNYGIQLVFEDKRQTILKNHNFFGNGPSLVWSGDIDRDDKIDLLLDCICEETSANMILYLSSLAEGLGRRRLHRPG